jgi:phosphoribosylglycinamide formyltransferase-1
MKNIAVLASGRGTNLQAIIENVENGTLKANLACVISDNKDAKALERARQHNIEAVYIDPGPKKTWLIPEVEQKYVQALKDRNVDLVCLAGFMRIIKTPLLEAFKGRILNIHPALLPSFPGLDVQRKAFEYGVKFSGCTAHFVTADVDAGPIVTQAVVPVLDDDTPEKLAERILKEEWRIYTEAINIILSGKYRIEGRRVIRTG